MRAKGTNTFRSSPLPLSKTPVTLRACSLLPDGVFTRTIRLSPGFIPIFSASSDPTMAWFSVLSSAHWPLTFHHALRLAAPVTTFSPAGVVISLLNQVPTRTVSWFPVVAGCSRYGVKERILLAQKMVFKLLKLASSRKDWPCKGLYSTPPIFTGTVSTLGSTKMFAP